MLKRSLDILALSGLVVLAALAAFALPEGSAFRWGFTLPVVLVAPGYLLLQAIFVPARPVGSRLVHALLSLGISPAIVGLLALSTALVPGGFQRSAIVGVVAVGCMVLGGLGLFRRAREGDGHRGGVERGPAGAEA